MLLLYTTLCDREHAARCTLHAHSKIRGLECRLFLQEVAGSLRPAWAGAVWLLPTAEQPHGHTTRLPAMPPTRPATVAAGSPAKGRGQQSVPKASGRKIDKPKHSMLKSNASTLHHGQGEPWWPRRVIAVLCMCVAWAAHKQYCATKFENERFFSMLTDTERETSFKSEQVSCILPP
jgi:hypothetical protein